MGRHGFMTALRKPQCAVTVSYGAPETTMGRCGFIWPSGNHNGPLWFHDGPPETTNRLWAVEEQLLEGHRAESLSWEEAATQWAVGAETFASVVAMEGVASSAVAEDERPMAEGQAAEATRARPSSEGGARRVLPPHGAGGL